MNLIKKIKSIPSWFKALGRVVATFDRAVLRLQEADATILDRAERAEQFIRERTEVNLDLSVNPKDANTVVVIGRYKNQDYVEVFSIHGDNFAKLVDTLRDMARFHEVSRVDCPHHMKYFVDDHLRGL